MVLSIDPKKQGRRLSRLTQLAREHHVPVRNASSDELTQLTGADHRGAVLTAPARRQNRYASLREFLQEYQNRREGLMLLLDGITDPQNVGAILRSADQFSADLVVLPGRRSAGVNETVMKVSAGAARHVPTVTVGNLAQALRDVQQAGFWVYAADIDGMPLKDVSFPEKTAVVLGSEGRGVSRLVGELCDHRVTIPVTGHIDSLNVSVAAGILLYEVRRQR